MRRQSNLPFALAVLVPIALLACGGNRPADQAAAPAASTPAPAAAPAPPPTAPPMEPAAAPTEERVAQASPPAATPVRKPAAKPAQTATPVPTPAPLPPPKPEPVAKTVPVGTELIVELVNGASSQTSQVGNAVRARVTRAVVIDGLTVIPNGAIVNATVTEAVPLKKIGGTASLGLRFDSLDLSGGGRTAIAAAIREQGKSETGKDAGTIAGATAGGALLGRLLSKNDKTKGTLIGAAVGAAAGTGIAAGTKGQTVELPVGTTLALQLEQPVTITVQP
jgi:hypothetical protein